MVKAGIHIGPTKQGIENVTKGILAILSAKKYHNDEVLIKALDVLQHSSVTQGNTINNCSFTGIK